MKLLALLLFTVSCYAQLTSITGTFKTPDATPISGKVMVSLTRSTITIGCSATTQVVAFKTITVLITNGTLGALSLYATSCISPSQTYLARVFDKSNNLLYQGRWSVPNTGTADVTVLDAK